VFKQGDIINKRYKIKKVIGKGGQVIVYLCEDQQRENAEVVLKECLFKCNDDDERKKELALFEQEATILRDVIHRNLPRVYDIFEAECSHFIVEEYIQGISLDRWLKKAGGKLKESQVMTIALQLTSLLHHLHTHTPPVVIRDIKPSNMIIQDDDHIYFIDFTIARYAIKDKEDTVRMGSPGYAPPEQYRGLSSPRSDMYSLGVTLHQLLTGHDPLTTPFTLPSPCRVNTKIARKWEEIICRATQLSAEQRYSSVKDMEDDLLALAKKIMPPQAASQAQSTATSSASSRLLSRPLKIAIALLGTLALFVAISSLIHFCLKHRKVEYINLSGCFNNITGICLSLEHYTSDKGSFPPDLQALVPDYLRELPKCPRRADATYVLEKMEEKETREGSNAYRIATFRVSCRGAHHTNLAPELNEPFKIVILKAKKKPE
jgi:serine/threonine protein kinase